MQTPAPAAAPPAPLASPASPSFPIQIPVGPGGITQGAPPLTAAEIAGIKARRSELSDQLTSAQGRRNRIASQLESASPALRPGLEARIKQLDERILGIEQEIAETGRQLTSAAAGPGLTNGTTFPVSPFDFGGTGGPSGPMTGIIIVLTIFVLSPISVALSRLIWRRAVRPLPAASPFAAESAQRLERVEQAVDAIAVEVERISEGQRFVTRLMSESLPALGEGTRPAEPIRVPDADAVPVRAGGR